MTTWILPRTFPSTGTMHSTFTNTPVTAATAPKRPEPISEEAAHLAGVYQEENMGVTRDNAVRWANRLVTNAKGKKFRDPWYDLK